MKELDILFNEIDGVINDTYFFDSGMSRLPFKSRAIKRVCQSAIEVYKQILRTRVKYRLSELSTADIQENTEKEEAEIEQITQSLSAKTSVIMAIIMRKNLIPFISSEAMYELKYISPINQDAIDENLDFIRERLLGLNGNDRKLYARTLCQDMDARLYSSFDNIRLLEDMGWGKYYFVNSIYDCLIYIFELFASFDIDLCPIIKENSDFEKDFGNYNDFRSKKYSSKSKDSKQEHITEYLNLKDDEKCKWISEGKKCNTVKELAEFLAQSYTNKILRKIPSKKGGGLWNLAKAAFQIEDTDTNRKTIENEFKLVYNPPIIPDKFK